MITTSPPTRFLIIQTAFIGDVILATALLEQLHRRFPDAQLDFLVRKGNEFLLTNHPFLNEILIWDKKQSKYRSLYRLWQLIRHRRYDVVINLQRFGATGLLTAFSGAPVTIGFAKNPFSRHFTYRVGHRLEPDVHEVDRNASLLTYWPTPFSFPDEHTERTKPKLYPSQADYEAVNVYQTLPYNCVAPTSVWFTKQYPREKWVDLIRQLPAHQPIYLLGAPGDRDACDWIQREAGQHHVVNLAGKLTLLQSAALVANAEMNYVNDSAPLHLCSAMNAPTTAIFCSTTPAFGFGPLADGARTVQTREPLDCRPCTLHGRKACPLGHYLCATTIQTEQVLG